MSGGQHTSLVDELVAVGKCLVNEATLRDVKHATNPLSLSELESAPEQEAPAVRGGSELSHKASRIEMLRHAAQEIFGLANVEGIRIVSPVPSEYVHTRLIGKPVEVEHVALTLLSQWNWLVPACVNVHRASHCMDWRQY